MYRWARTARWELPHYRPQSSLDRVEHRLLDRIGLLRRVDQDAACALFLGNPAEALAKPFMERLVEALEPVGGRSGGGPRQTDLNRQIEDQRKIGSEIAESQTVQRGEVTERKASAVTLIGEGRIGKAVGDDPDPLSQRRLDQPGHMVAPGGDEQQGFTDRIPALAFAFEQQSPDRLGARRSSGLACSTSCYPRPPERCNEQPDLGRFAGAFAALDGDEPAPRHSFSSAGGSAPLAPDEIARERSDAAEGVHALDARRGDQRRFDGRNIRCGHDHPPDRLALFYRGRDRTAILDGDLHVLARLVRQRHDAIPADGKRHLGLGAEPDFTVVDLVAGAEQTIVAEFAKCP